MIDLALSPEDEQKRNQTMQMQQAPLAQVQSPQPQQKGMAGQMGDMVKQKLMSDAAGAGAKAITAGAKQGMSSMLAPTVGSALEGGAVLGPMAGGGGMAAIGTAMPYVGAGLLAGKALGLFNEGGQVGPLSPQYAASGYPGSDTLKSYIGRNPESIGALKTEYDVRNKAQQEDLARQKRLLAKSYEDLTPFKTINNILNEFGNPYGSELERQAAFNRGFAENYGDLLNQYRDAKGYDQGGQVSMNDNDEINKILDEIEAEEASQMVEGAMGTPMPMPMMRPPLGADPLNADTTYSPYDMIRPDNAPNT